VILAACYFQTSTLGRQKVKLLTTDVEYIQVIRSFVFTKNLRVLCENDKGRQLVFSSTVEKQLIFFEWIISLHPCTANDLLNIYYFLHNYVLSDYY